jgi:hypothetical protein
MAVDLKASNIEVFTTHIFGDWDMVNFKKDGKEEHVAVYSKGEFIADHVADDSIYEICTYTMFSKTSPHWFFCGSFS